MHREDERCVTLPSTRIHLMGNITGIRLGAGLIFWVHRLAFEVDLTSCMFFFAVIGRRLLE